MATTLKPDMEARVADLAKRMGFAGPDAVERVLKQHWTIWTPKHQCRAAG